MPEVSCGKAELMILTIKEHEPVFSPATVWESSCWLASVSVILSDDKGPLWFGRTIDSSHSEDEAWRRLPIVRENAIEFALASGIDAVRLQQN